jgi:hypothetical protein
MKSKVRYPKPPPVQGRIIDARLHLLDRQVLDAEGVPVTTVDDLELNDVPPSPDPIEPGTPAPVITALLSGPVLATRILGGRPPRSRHHRIPWSDLTGVGIVLSLRTRAEDLDVTWVERWVRDHIICRIPGGRHDPQ